ncbi:MAG: C10 family peptidase [Candidatus Cloacimonas sp.]|jgi:hypothetical protein|nr:C10 family peptidase [Candidatus Cloacimonas sp.]
MKRLLIALLCLTAIALGANTISPQQARQLAETKMLQLYPHLQLTTEQTLESNSQVLAYVFKSQPSGYIVVSAKTELPPVLAYSGTAQFTGSTAYNPLAELIIADLSNRLRSPEEAQRNNIAWQNAFAWQRLTQWPPAGHSATEGWVETLWTQTAPYNLMCPLNLANNTHCFAGCPAIAMGQIVNYHQALNGTRLSDADDYHHNYGGNNYWIDNDFSTYGFPSFPQLNGYLDDINTCFRYNLPLSDSLKAALVFACGTALTQVYNSAGSGTFGVNQALAAFQRFNFPDSELLVETSPNLYNRISDNVKNALPVHLAVVTPAWDSGHNVVVDGYNTNDFYHLNFGWGGTYNGWYLLPSQIPYGLTVVEGAIVDIKPYQYVFCVPDTLLINDSGIHTLEIVNLHSEPVVLQALLPQDSMQSPEWHFSPSSPLPATIPVNGMMSIDVQYLIPIREDIQTGFRLILDHGFTNVPVTFDSGVANHDQTNAPQTLLVSCYPNPFSSVCKFKVPSKASLPVILEIFNLKGQKVFGATRTSETETSEFSWGGNNQAGKPCPSGIYLYRISKGNQIVAGKLLKLK